MPMFHTITPMANLQSASYLERVAILITGAALWPLDDDQRMGVLLSALITQVINTAETEGEIDALVDVLRTRLLLEWHDVKKDSHGLR